MQDIHKSGGTGATWVITLVCETCGRLESARLHGYTHAEVQELASVLVGDHPKADRCVGCGGVLRCRVTQVGPARGDA